jgi:hypothetical protein
MHTMQHRHLLCSPADIHNSTRARAWVRSTHIVYVPYAVSHTKNLLCCAHLVSRHRAVCLLDPGCTHHLLLGRVLLAFSRFLSPVSFPLLSFLHCPGQFVLFPTTTDNGPRHSPDMLTLRSLCVTAALAATAAMAQSTSKTTSTSKEAPTTSSAAAATHTISVGAVCGLSLLPVSREVVQKC